MTRWLETSVNWTLAGSVADSKCSSLNKSSDDQAIRCVYFSTPISYSRILAALDNRRGEHQLFDFFLGGRATSFAISAIFLPDVSIETGNGLICNIWSSLELVGHLFRKFGGSEGVWCGFLICTSSTEIFFGQKTLRYISRETYHRV